MKYLFVILIALSLVLASCSVIKPQEEKPKTVTLSEVFNLVNEARSVSQTCGQKSFPAVPKLSYNSQLAKAAQNHSIEMYDAGVLSHLSPANSKFYEAGTTALKRIKEEGYRPSIIRENIARGQISAQEVIKAWLASPGHCESIMSDSISEIGLGHSGTYWTQDFGQE